MVNVDALEQALERFDRAAPKARNLADNGDASALSQLVDRVLAGERSLRDEGVLREIAAIAPAAADRFASYLAFPFPREARARAAMAQSEAAAGKARWSAAEAMARVRLGDAAERTSAMAALSALDLDPLEELAPEGRRIQVAKAPPAKAGSILVPTPELMAELGLVAGTGVAPSAEVGPDRSRELADHLLGLAESVSGRRPLEYGELRSAAAGREVADFRVRHRWVSGGGILPFEQPGVPLSRAGGRAIEGGDAASSAARLTGVEGGSALLFASTTTPFSGCFADAGSDRRRAARAMAATIGLMALECELAGRAGTVDELLDRERDSVGFSRPRWFGRVLWIGCRFESAPGEDTARYAGGSRLGEWLAKGAALAADLRERFDEDWFRNPRVSWEVLIDSELATVGSIDRVIEWLKESARL